jgi:D-alanyl-lipoteichoic acid acyltransferase DltB (MBOAT superfamily)
MSFLSLKFFTFFSVIFYIYWNLGESSYKKRILLIFSSALFYSFFSISFLLHYLFIIGINYLFLKYLIQSKYYLKITIIFNLLNLFLFKYFYFVLSVVGELSGISFLKEKPELDKYISSLLGVSGFEIILPASISFYTFQFISIAVDKKSGKVSSQIGLLDFLSYFLFFPVLVAGPILRYLDLRPQMDKIEINQDDMTEGIWLVLRGILKKSILSDTLTTIIYPVFAMPEKYSGLALLLTTYFFGIHLFLDFSGLTDMARGIAKLLGFDLPENFKAPFFMKGFGDFWRRWHLTFSFWIRDYIYIPLGGSRVSEWRNYFNFIITFTLGGLWHGSSMTYLLWGTITGFYLSVEKFLETRNWNLIPESKFKVYIKYFFVLNLSIVTWVLFFAKDVSTAFLVIGNILMFKNGLSLSYAETGIYAMVFTIFFHFVQEFPEKFAFLDKYKLRNLPIFALIIILTLLNNEGNIDFFYTRF